MSVQAHVFFGALFLVVLQTSSTFCTKTVVVIGGGLAGCCAAIEAHNHGAHVIILEKTKRVAGNSIKASSGMNAVYTPAQEIKSIQDTPQLFAADTLKSGQKRSNQELVHVLVERSRAAWDFLQNLGVNLSVVSQTGGHCRARTHRCPEPENGPAPNIGSTIMHIMQEKLAQLPDITVITQACAKNLVLDKAGVIHGVVYEQKKQLFTLAADAVILATGGYCGQTDEQSLLAHYRPDLAHLATTNGSFATGDGIALAERAGARLIDMDQIQVHPTGFVDPHDPNELRKFLAPESLRAAGGILLNKNGERFVNELGPRDYVTNAILKSCSPYTSALGESGPISAYLILNEAGAQLFGKAILGFYAHFGFVPTVDNARSLANYLGAKYHVIKKTLLNYVNSAKIGLDEFGKTVFPITFKLDEPLYIMIVTPCLHYCMGGIAFDAQARVLDTHNNPIPGLFGAGEVTGGLHGANRLCGNSLLECVVFGRIAGENATV